jgi:hypothetical protein
MRQSHDYIDRDSSSLSFTRIRHKPSTARSINTDA